MTSLILNVIFGGVGFSCRVGIEPATCPVGSGCLPTELQGPQGTGTGAGMRDGGVLAGTVGVWGGIDRSELRESLSLNFQKVKFKNKDSTDPNSHIQK